MAKNLNKWLDEFVKNGADANNVVDWPENAGSGGIAVVDELPETGKEGDLVVLKNTDDKIVISDDALCFIKDEDTTDLENITRNQLNISEEIECQIDVNILYNLDDIGEYTITKINSAEDLIGQDADKLHGTYLSIKNLKFENYLLAPFLPPIGPIGPGYINKILLEPIEFEGIFTKSTIIGNKLYLYVRHPEIDKGTSIITGFTDWKAQSEYSIVKFNNKDEFIDFSNPENQHIIDENNALYGENQWVYLGEFSEPIYTKESTYVLYIYSNGQWNAINTNSSSSSDSKNYSPACYRYGALDRAIIMFDPDATYTISTESLIEFLTDDIMGYVPFEPHEDGSEQYPVKYFSNSGYSLEIWLSRRSSSESASLWISIGGQNPITYTISDLINESGDTVSSFLNKNKQVIRETLQEDSWDGATLVSNLINYSHSHTEDFCAIQTSNPDLHELANVVKFLNIFVKQN